MAAPPPTIRRRNRRCRQSPCSVTASARAPASWRSGRHGSSSAASLSPAERLARFRGETDGKIVFTTSFGLEDQVILHLIARARDSTSSRHARHRQAVPRDLRAVGGDRAPLRPPHPRHLSAASTASKRWSPKQGINGFYASRDARTRLLPCSQGRAAQSRARRRGGMDRRPARRPVEPSRSAPGSSRVDRARPPQAQPALRLDARGGADLRRAPTKSRPIRCTPRGSRRSAARRARAPSRRASRSAPAAGGGRTTTRRSAACIPRPSAAPRASPEPAPQRPDGRSPAIAGLSTSIRRRASRLG